MQQIAALAPDRTQGLYAGASKQLILEAQRRMPQAKYTDLMADPELMLDSSSDEDEACTEADEAQAARLVKTKTKPTAHAEARAPQPPAMQRKQLSIRDFAHPRTTPAGVAASQPGAAAAAAAAAARPITGFSAQKDLRSGQNRSVQGKTTRASAEGGAAAPTEPTSQKASNAIRPATQATRAPLAQPATAAAKESDAFGSCGTSMPCIG